MNQKIYLTRREKIEIFFKFIYQYIIKCKWLWLVIGYTAIVFIFYYQVLPLGNNDKERAAMIVMSILLSFVVMAVKLGLFLCIKNIYAHFNKSWNTFYRQQIEEKNSLKNKLKAL